MVFIGLPPIATTSLQSLLYKKRRYSGNGFSSAEAVSCGISESAAAVAVAGGVVLRIRLRFHHHAPQQLAIGLAFHQLAADELGGDQLGGAGEEGWGEVTGGRGGYGSGLAIIDRELTKNGAT